MQGVGLIVETGRSVDHLKVGAPVAIMTFGCYAEFMIVCNLCSFYFQNFTFFPSVTKN